MEGAAGAPPSPSAAPAHAFTVAEGDPRDRLDKLCVAVLSRAGVVASRATIQRWIDHGRVLVNGAPARASSAVALGAHVEVRPEPPPATTAAPDAGITLTVVYEDAHLVVIDKPAGLVVHPARGHEGGTLVNALLARGGFERASADPRDPAGHLRPGIVHRLDKGTSGLMVVAKDEPTREGLKALFSKHDIDREYAGIVAGRIQGGLEGKGKREGEGDDIVIDTLHARHPTDRLRFTSRTDAGRRAITRVRVLERFEGAALVSCRLETGRTHQIRVHLAERANAPILGDPLYGRPPKSALLRELAEALGRQALHARVLGFVHPATGKAMRWESALPADMERVLAALRATRSSI